MTDTPTIDTEKVKQELLEATKQGLVEQLQGKKPNYSWEERGKAAPETYDELFSEVKKQLPTLSQEDIDKRVEEKLAERDRLREEAEKESKKKETEEIEARRRSFDTEWFDLVNQGKMPKPDDKIMERISRGESLTMEEIKADEGLRARLELAEVAKNKSAKLAFYEDYNKEPAGAHAPVLGGRPSTPQKESQELDYDRDVAPMRKRIYGY